MASVSPTIADFRLSSSFQVNYINFGWTVTNHVSGTIDKTFDFSAIPTGSTINSATLYSTTTLGNYHLRHLFLNVNGAGYENFYDISGGVRYKDVKAAIQTLVTAGTKSITIGYKFGATSNSPSSLGTGTKSTYMDFADNSIVISYTAPYSKCTAPTTVTVSPTSTGKSKTASLSWSGAGNGTNNTVNGYDIYHSTTSATSGFSDFHF